MSLQEPSAGKKPPAKKDKITGGVNLKKSIAKKTKPKDTESNGKLKVPVMLSIRVGSLHIRYKDSWYYP